VSLAGRPRRGRPAAQHLLGMCVRAIDYLPSGRVRVPGLPGGPAGLRRRDRPGRQARLPGRRPRRVRPVGHRGRGRPHRGPVALRPHRRLPQPQLHRAAQRHRRGLPVHLGKPRTPPDRSALLHPRRARPPVRPGRPRRHRGRGDGGGIHPVLEGTPGALSRAIGLRVPRAVSPGTRVRVLGGGTLVFDEFGRAKYHHRKDIRDTGRQHRRLSYLVGNGLFDEQGPGRLRRHAGRAAFRDPAPARRQP